VVEVRHDSFCVPDFIALLRKFENAVVFAEHGKYPAIADVVSDFVYARLQKGNDELKTCYPPKQLDAWAKRFQAWAAAASPTICRGRQAKPQERRATCSPMSSTRARCARRPAPMELDRAREVTSA
jgi:uncharacterized protein YecE (DUF72 family)